MWSTHAFEQDCFTQCGWPAADIQTGWRAKPAAIQFVNLTAPKGRILKRSGVVENVHCQTSLWRAVVVFSCASQATWRSRECCMAGWAVLFQGSLIPIRAWTVALQEGQAVGTLPVFFFNGFFAFSETSVKKLRAQPGDGRCPTEVLCNPEPGKEKWSLELVLTFSSSKTQTLKPQKRRSAVSVLAGTGTCFIMYSTCLLVSLWDMWPGRSEQFLCSCFLWWLCRMRQTPWVKLLQRLSCWETSQFLQ